MKLHFILHMPPMGKARPRHCGRHSYMPPAYVKYKKAAVEQILKQTDGLLKLPISQPMRLVTIFYTKSGKCRSDVDNSHSSILDVLQDAGIISNDRWITQGEYGLFKCCRGMDNDQIVCHLSTLNEE